MTDNNEKINQLGEKLEALLNKQNNFLSEINDLRFELNKLIQPEQSIETTQVEEIEAESQITDSAFADKNENIAIEFNPTPQPEIQEPVIQLVQPIINPPRQKSDLEKIIGESIINKIGIAITIIGVIIGAKYSIDNNLISPLTRIVLGYLLGLGLLGIGIKLKLKYENYSAVLVSGAMTIMYFLTFTAYGLYSLIPQSVAFVLMVFFTIFTVIAALNYNRQVIAHIALVGAYAVPFLLSTGLGQVVILFSYITVLNIGIVVLAFKKYWKPLYLVSFGFTWLIFLSWFVFKYNESYFGVALLFSIIFFVIFYLTFLAYKLIRKEIFAITDIALILINSFIFYGIGFTAFNSLVNGNQLLGLFTLANAIIHFIVSVVIYRQKLVERNIYFLFAGLVLIFITIAAPVQLDGNWVTLLWAGEAALLFWIGSTKNVSFYEKISYLLMILAFFSIIQDWRYAYSGNSFEYYYTNFTALFNIHFLSSILFIAAFVFITIINLNKNYSSCFEKQISLSHFISYAIFATLIFTIYSAFALEITHYWSQLYNASSIEIKLDNDNYENYYNSDLTTFKTIWILNYSLLFVSILWLVNHLKFKNKQFVNINSVLICLALFVFLIQGLYNLSELRKTYIEQELIQYYQRGTINLWFRYVSFPFVALALFACYKNMKQEVWQKDNKVLFHFLLHVTILWIASSELINWMNIHQAEQPYNLGLSILWGLYSLFLIALGINKNSKPMRFGAIGLFGITLLKLFFYDIAALDTIAKTIVFVLLGILLLIISFLYNKYKHLITDETTNSSNSQHTDNL